MSFELNDVITLYEDIVLWCYMFVENLFYQDDNVISRMFDSRDKEGECYCSGTTEHSQ